MMFPSMFRPLVSLAAVSAVLALGACASKPATPEAKAELKETNDKLEPFNRAMFKVDQGLDAVIVRPVAWTYKTLTPDFAQDGVTNFLRNLRSPITFANDILQGDMNRAGETMGRFLVNTTIGIGGLFDVGKKLGVEHHYEDFGQTLAVWGVKDGSYLYLPIIGPTSVRDGFGFAVDNFAFDPVSWYSYADNPGWVQWAYFGTLLIDTKANTMDVTDELKASSIDYYASLRAAYRQNRAKEVRNGAPAPLPPMSTEDGDPFAEPAK